MNLLKILILFVFTCNYLQNMWVWIYILEGSYDAVMISLWNVSSYLPLYITDDHAAEGIPVFGRHTGSNPMLTGTGGTTLPPRSCL